MIAWAIGLLPSLLGERVDGWPPAALVALALPLGLALLLAMGALQSRVLRAFVPRAGAWVPAVALAWLCGLLVFGAVATPLWHEGQALAVTIAVGLLGGVLMAATVAALSGAALVRLLDAPRWR